MRIIIIYHRFCPHCGSEMLLERHLEVSYSPSSGADMRGENE